MFLPRTSGRSLFMILKPVRCSKRNSPIHRRTMSRIQICKRMQMVLQPFGLDQAQPERSQLDPDCTRKRMVRLLTPAHALSHGSIKHGSQVKFIRLIDESRFESSDLHPRELIYSASCDSPAAHLIASVICWRPNGVSNERTSCPSSV